MIKVHKTRFQLFEIETFYKKLLKCIDRNLNAFLSFKLNFIVKLNLSHYGKN